jgi:hypothetical protein
MVSIDFVEPIIADMAAVARRKTAREIERHYFERFGRCGGFVRRYGSWAGLLAL